MTTTTTRKPPLLSIRQVLANLPANTASESSVRHWILTGALPSTKVGRHRLVRRADLAKFLGVEVEDLIA